MGILNVTPDSFYAPSRRTAAEEAVRRGLELEAEGADLIDVGGESTRPGADPVETEEESRRVLPVLEALAGRLRVPLSIDTSRAAVARGALEAGATVLNDVCALRRDSGMPAVARRFSEVILMHMRGVPKTMQERPVYRDVVSDILDFFRERLEACSAAGLQPGRVLLDPGIGFGKAIEHNLEILRRLEEFHVLGRPLVLGVSRKSFLGRLMGNPEAPLPPEDRLEGSLSVACRAASAGAALLRVHDVRATRKALQAYCAVQPPARRSGRLVPAGSSEAVRG